MPHHLPNSYLLNKEGRNNVKSIFFAWPDKHKTQWEKERHRESEIGRKKIKQENSNTIPMVMDNWSERVRMVLCKLPKQLSSALMITEDVNNVVVPRCHRALLFFLPSNYPWGRFFLTWVLEKNHPRNTFLKKKKVRGHPWHFSKAITATCVLPV